MIEQIPSHNPFIIKGCTAIIFLKHIHMRCILIKKTCLISKYLSPMSPMPGEMRLNFWKGENNHFVLTKLGIVSINQTTKLHKLNWHFKTVKKCSNKVSIQIYFYLYYILYLTRWTWMKKVLYFFYIVIQIILNNSDKIYNFHINKRRPWNTCTYFSIRKQAQLHHRMKVW